jgi:hypothetical protein
MGVLDPVATMSTLAAAKAGGFDDVFSTLTRPTFWARVLTGFGGVALIYMGVAILLLSSEKVRGLAKDAVMSTTPVGKAATVAGAVT